MKLELKTANPGPVHQGSTLVDDLLEPCGNCLERLFQDNKEYFDLSKNVVANAWYNNLIESWRSEKNNPKLNSDDRECLLDDLFFALDAFCPDNHYFGPCSEDKDVGFWPID